MDTTMNSNMNQSATAAAATVSNEELGLSMNAMSGLSYFLGIIAIIALVVDPYKKDAKVRFNAVQSLLFSGTWVASSIVIAIVTTVVTLILGAIFNALSLYSLSALVLGAFAVITPCFHLVMLGIYVYLIVGGATGKTPFLPVLSAYARKFSKT